MSEKRVAWGITGAGDLLQKTLNVLVDLNKKYKAKVSIEVYLSKAGDQVTRFYKIDKELKEHFGKVFLERDANTPFITGPLQLGHFEFLLIAPATSNTVAKLAHGISDTMLTNGAIQALKASIPVYIMPVDYREGIVVTTLPSGKKIELRVRKEDVENARKISKMDGITVFEKPEFINSIFQEKFG